MIVGDRSRIRESLPCRRELLFVYGTLLSQGGHASLLGGCELLGSGVVEGLLYDLGDYPALVLGPGAAVHGEFWCCPPETLDRLDAYEGVGEGLFARMTFESSGGDCWVYVAGPGLIPNLDEAVLVPSGRWTLAR